MPMNRQLDEEVMVHIYNGYYSAIKNEILPFALMWMYLEVIMLSEVTQTEKEANGLTR